MPNHCANKLTGEGAGRPGRGFREKARGEKEVFDLNKFIPMPDEFRGTEAPSHDPKVVAELTEKYGAPDGHVLDGAQLGHEVGSLRWRGVRRGRRVRHLPVLHGLGAVPPGRLAQISEGYPETLFTLAFAERLMTCGASGTRGGARSSASPAVTGSPAPPARSRRTSSCWPRSRCKPDTADSATIDA